MFKWDSFSDQPYQLKNKAKKRELKKQNRWNILKTIFLALFTLPPLWGFSLFLKSKKFPKLTDFFAIAVNLDKGERQLNFLNELQIKHISMRFPLEDIKNINKYLEFAKKLSNYKILIVILQNRETIENPKLLEKNIYQTFEKFTKLGISEFQIGNAINRTKWGFFSITEYLNFFEIVFKVKQKSFPNIKLIGSNVIDFEYFNTIHTLFNFKDFFYDGVGALLYVDRRGSPENKQALFFDLINKIRFLYAIIFTSSKTKNHIYITETNYPIVNTKPYTPTSQFETVSTRQYSKYMIKYFLLALGSGFVKRVYWHQLFSAGYGLIDHRENEPKPYLQFLAFKTMLSILKDYELKEFKIEKNGNYIFNFDEVLIIWNNKNKQTLHFKNKVKVISIFGKISFKNQIIISDIPQYINLKKI